MTLYHLCGNNIPTKTLNAISCTPQPISVFITINNSVSERNNQADSQVMTY